MNMAKRPKLIVFDLDYTLWPFWVDTHVDPPFKKKSDGKVYDSHSRHVKYYPDVPGILSSLKSQRYQLGIASRTTCSDEAWDLVQLFEWDKYFDYKQIYPGSKTNHFTAFKNQSNLPYEDMLFFDDEHRNIEDVGRLGVTCIHVADGLTEACLKMGLETFAKNNS
ncbi:hypothetical protein CHS0354_030565 [Potamilus streckersoni]|uniref:Magnesium-dependent phosphatase 1 n=1 Tax=Potamilus streckersoni TaxID=2493646 RepID=A0AAE0S3Q9_9BIVA|nr:hypothetical protein CHS0354_030565 [Potamilus streckersoni]